MPTDRFSGLILGTNLSGTDNADGTITIDATGGGGGFTEIAYQAITTDTTETTTGVVFEDLVSFGSLALTATKHYLDVFVPVLRHTVANASVYFELWNDTDSVRVNGFIQQDCATVGGQGLPVAARLVWTPAAATKTFKIRWAMNTAGTRTIRATSMAPASFLIWTP